MKFVSRSTLTVVLLLWLAAPVPASAADKEAKTEAEAATLYRNVCANCHGGRGEGKQELKAPSIAGLPDWYAHAQLENFRNDRRGTHLEDKEGQMMRAVSKVLTEDQAKAMARYVATLPRVTPTPTIRADVKAGQDLYAERCMECHRYNAEGELFFDSPPLVGLQDWYLATQIRKYQTGVRGVHPKDVNGQKMVFSSGFVESEEMLHSLVAYLMELQKPKDAEAGGDDPFEKAARNE